MPNYRPAAYSLPRLRHAIVAARAPRVISRADLLYRNWMADILKAEHWRDIYEIKPTGIYIGNRQTGEVRNGTSRTSSSFLLGHEPTNTLQWDLLGPKDFVDRYADEYPKYGVPPSLAEVPLGYLDVTDARWSLDQIADRMGKEAVDVGRSLGLIP